MPMTTRGHISLFLACCVTHKQKCHVLLGLQRVLKCWLCPEGAGLGLSRSGLRTRRACTRHPMSTWDEFNSWTGTRARQVQPQWPCSKHSRRGLRRPLALMWIGHWLPRSGVSACLPIKSSIPSGCFDDWMTLTMPFSISPNRWGLWKKVQVSTMAQSGNLFQQSRAPSSKRVNCQSNFEVNGRSAGCLLIRGRLLVGIVLITHRRIISLNHIP